MESFILAEKQENTPWDEVSFVQLHACNIKKLGEKDSLSSIVSKGRHGG
jgi:hypothetical protein